MKDIMATAPSALYLRLPPRAAIPFSPASASALSASSSASSPSRSPVSAMPVLSFAVASRGRLQRIGHASLPELTALMQQVPRVILLLAASDVSLFRIAVPPLSAARLKAALPALIEDRVIGDPAECAIALGPVSGNGSNGNNSGHGAASGGKPHAGASSAMQGGERLVAVADRAWLQDWLQLLRRQGARRVSALPFALCLPLPAGQVAASVVEHGDQRELVLRLSAHEAMGLPLVSDSADALPAEVFQLLSTFAGQRPVQLALPSGLMQAFRAAFGDDGADTGGVNIALREENWAAWVEGAGYVTVDLAAGIAAEHSDATDWGRWRWPLALTAGLLLVNVAALNWDWWRLRSEGQQLRDAMEHSFRQHFPNETVVDPVAQLRQKVAASRQAAGEFVPGDFIALSASLGDVWAEAAPAIGVDARAIAALEYRDAVLTVRFKPGQQPSLDAARSVLAARGLEATAVAGDGAQWQLRSIR